MKSNKTLYNNTNPIVLRITNMSNINRKWVIFGSNKFLNSNNFGSDENVVIENLTARDSSYVELLQELSNSKIKVGAMRFWADKKSNIHQTITHHKYYNNVRLFDVYYEQRNLNLSLMLDAYQFQSDIIDAPIEFEISNNTCLSGSIAKESYILITLYPCESNQYSSFIKIINKIKYKSKSLLSKVKIWFKKKY